MTPLRRRILGLHNGRNKFGVPCAPLPVPAGSREEVKRMVAEKLVVHLDRALVTKYKVPCDIYLLTPAGVALCEAEAIPPSVEEGI